MGATTHLLVVSRVVNSRLIRLTGRCSMRILIGRRRRQRRRVRPQLGKVLVRVLSRVRIMLVLRIRMLVLLMLLVVRMMLQVGLDQ